MLSKSLKLVSLASALFASSAIYGNSCDDGQQIYCPAGQVDSCTIAGGNATHHFCTTRPQAQYTYLGRLNITEKTTGIFTLANGTPEIKGFRLGMEQACTLVKGAVVKLDPNQVVEPTRLIGQRVGDDGYTALYDFSVNGGFGVMATGIMISIGAVGGPIITDVCPVDVYGRF